MKITMDNHTHSMVVGFDPEQNTTFETKPKEGYTVLNPVFDVELPKGEAILIQTPDKRISWKLMVDSWGLPYLTVQ